MKVTLSMSKTIHHWINGAEVAGQSGRFSDVYNPAFKAKSAPACSWPRRPMNSLARSLLPRQPSRPGRPRRRCAARG